MSQYRDGGWLGRPTASTLSAWVRVKLNSSGQFALAGAGDAGVGVIHEQVLTSGDEVAARLWQAPGTHKVMVDGAVTIGDYLMPVASGKFTSNGATDGGMLRAMETATADGDVIEAVYVGPPVFRQTHVVTSGEAAANSGDGRADIVTNLDTASLTVSVQVLNVTTLVENTGYVVSLAATAGTIRIDGVAAGVQLDEGDIIHVVAFPNL